MAAKISFHIQTTEAKPIAGATIRGLSTQNGDWEGRSDAQGNFDANLAPGHYTGIISAPGRVTRTIPWDLRDPGSVIVGLDPEVHPAPLTVAPAPVVSADMIDLGKAVIVNSPNVRDWAATAKITEVVISPGGASGNTRIEFTKRLGKDCWPNVIPTGWDGPLQYTVWLFLNLGGVWTGSGFIQCWQDRAGCGDSISDYPINWYYPSAWHPMTGHVIQPGEQIAYMVTAGSARGGSEAFSVAERSNVVTIHAPAGDSGTFKF
jgi:hypothetical protein